VPFSWILNEPAATIEEIERHDFSCMKNHIIVCCASFRLQRFLCAVRTPHLKADKLKPVIIIASEKPTDSEFKSLSSFPEIYFLQGDPCSIESLERANLLESSVIVLLDLSRNWDDASDRNKTVPQLADSSTM
jgi:hypothetical protein